MINCGSLNEDDLKFFSENGYLGPFKSPFNNAEIQDGLRVASESGAYLQELKGMLESNEFKPPHSDIYDWSQVDLSVNSNLSDDFRIPAMAYNISTRDKHIRNPEIFQLLAHPELVNRLASILGPDLNLWRSQLFIAPPGVVHHKHEESFIHWHQGANFTGYSGHPSIVPSDSLTIWMPLTPVNKNTSTLRLVPRTHRLGPIPLTDEGKNGRFRDELAWSLDYSQAVDVECGPGDFIIFDEYLVHGSRKNSTNEARVALAGRFSPVTTHVNKETWLFDSTISPDSPNPYAQGLSLPRLKFPVQDCRYDNFGLPLDNWGCVLVRGKDDYKRNKMISPPAVVKCAVDTARLPTRLA